MPESTPPASTPPAGEGPSASPVTAAELNDRVAMPEVDESAIAASQATPEPVAPASAPAPVAAPPLVIPPGVDITKPDSAGRKFNPDSFQPRYDSIGRWISKRAGRSSTKPGETTGTPAPKVPASHVPPDSPAGSAAPGAGDRYDAAAELYCRTFYSFADSLMNGHGEWLPENDGEHAALRQSVAAYLRFKQADDLPPGWALAFGLSAYAGKRIQKPHTQTRLRVYLTWLRAKWDTWRGVRRLEQLPTIPIAPGENGHLPPKVDSFPGNRVHGPNGVNPNP